MDGCGPADFYESYKQLYAKAVELNKLIYEAEEIRGEIYHGGRCICGGEDCLYSTLEKAESQLASLFHDKANLIRKMETVIKAYKIAVETGYLKREMEKDLQELAEIKLTPKVKEPEINANINVAQKTQSQ